MSRRILQLSLLCTALTAPLAVQARNVFVTPPGDGVIRPVLPFTGDPFAPAATTITAAQDTFQVLATPSGSKYYFIGRSGTDTVVVTDSNYQVIARRTISTGATGATMTADGRYVFIAGGQNGTVQILRTADDNFATAVDAGGAIDVAISRDGLRAFAVNAAGLVTAIDTSTFAKAGTQQLTAGVGGIAVAPNGLIYVAATNALYELEYSNSNGGFTIRQNQAIGLNGVPGKPYLLAEGVSGLRAVMVNKSQFPGSAAIFNIDLNSRNSSNIVQQGVLFDTLIPVSFTRLYAISNSQQLYEINFNGGTVTPANFTGFAGAGVRGGAASNEFPNARYLYLASAATNTLARIDMTNGAVAPLLPLTSVPGGVSYAGPAATGTPAKVYTFNNGQSVTPGTVTQPLILRVVDANDRPLSGVPLSCSITSTTGGQINTSSSQTDGEGYAQVTATAPQLLGPFQVTCNAGSGVTVAAQFNLNAGSGPVGNTSGTVAVKSGNGQVIRETGATPELLRVVVRDANGNPLPGITVRWGVLTTNGPNGTLANSESVTDNLGEATNTYVAPFLGAFTLTGYVQSTITAATANNQVNMFVTVIPNQFSGNTLPLPTVLILKPTNQDTISGQAGTTITGAIQTRVTVGAGPGVGQPIPNVAINATTGLDPTVGPTAACVQEAGKGLSDATGVANCDLVIGGRTGKAVVTITMGGQTIGTLNLDVGFGLPGKINVRNNGGDNQRGPTGTQLPLALLAEVQDAFGNILPGAEVRWSVDSGTATIVNPITRADNQGLVSALVRLGAAPGPVKIRVTAVNGTQSAFAVFNLEATGGAVTLRTLSGDNQSAVVGQGFGQPLVVQAVDSNGQPVQGIQVSFNVRSGQASLSPASATTDAQGQARTIATAGIQTGAVVVAAEFAGNATLFNLTVGAQGPQISAANIVNAASGRAGVVPGSIVTLRGTSFATNVRGYVLPQSSTGPLPIILSGITVQFGGVYAPIFWVANVNGQESVTVQVPFEIPENTTIPVTIASGGASNSVNVQTAAVAPGIFEDVDSQNRRYGVVTRADGTFVTPDNPIQRGEQATVLVTGLGKTNTAAFTNAMGAGGQRPNASIAVGVGTGAANVVSVEYARGLIGVYAVTFEVPANATAGGINLSVGADPGSGMVFSNSSTLYVR